MRHSNYFLAWTLLLAFCLPTFANSVHQRLLFLKQNGTSTQKRAANLLMKDEDSLIFEKNARGEIIANNNWILVNGLLYPNRLKAVDDVEVSGKFQWKVKSGDRYQYLLATYHLPSSKIYHDPKIRRSRAKRSFSPSPVRRTNRVVRNSSSYKNGSARVNGNDRYSDSHRSQGSQNSDQNYNQSGTAQKSGTRFSDSRMSPGDSHASSVGFPHNSADSRQSSFDSRNSSIDSGQRSVESRNNSKDSRRDSFASNVRDNSGTDQTAPRVRSIRLERRNPLNGLVEHYVQGPVASSYEGVTVQIEFSEEMGSFPVLQAFSNSGELDAYFQNSPSPQIARYLLPFAGDSSQNNLYSLRVFATVSQGLDLAGNPLEEEIQSSWIQFDTIPARIRELQSGDNPVFQGDPYPNQKLAKHGIPRQLRIFVEDKNSNGENGSGFDFDLIDRPNGIQFQVFTPSGKEIPGTLAAQPPSLVYLLPDVYDLDSQIFEDLDGDGNADPEEGNYKVSYQFIDRAGNISRGQYFFFVDTTPIAESQIQFSFTPVMKTYSDPEGNFTNALQKVRIEASSEDFDVRKSNARLFSQLHGPGTIPDEMKTEVSKEERAIELSVDPDQNSDGKVDWPNPPRGKYLEEGQEDPRFGRNDGLYIVELDAFDTQGNEFQIKEEFVLDTTPPVLEMSFPSPGVTTAVSGPMRILEIVMREPVAKSCHKGSGIVKVGSSLELYYLGENGSLKERVRSILYYHKPNFENPDLPDYNPVDRYHRLLIEFIDAQGKVTSLPMDGSKDGLYQAEFRFFDAAGNEHQGQFQFRYESQTGSFEVSEIRVIS